MLLSSGFNANSTNRASAQLDAPAVVNLDNGMSSQLVLRMQPVVNAKSYEVQTKNGGGWTPAGIFTPARRDHPARPDTGSGLFSAIARHRRQHRLFRLERPRQPHGHVTLGSATKVADISAAMSQTSQRDVYHQPI